MDIPRGARHARRLLQASLDVEESSTRIEERILSDPDQHARVDATTDKSEGQSGKRVRFAETAEGEHPQPAETSSSSAPTSQTESRTERAAFGSSVPTPSSLSRQEAAGAVTGSAAASSSMEVDHKKRSREESGDVTSQMDPRLEDYESGDEGLLSEITRELGGDNVDHDLEEFVREANEREIDRAVERDPARPVPEGAELQEFLSQHLDYESQFFDTITECPRPTPSCMKP